MNANSYHWEKTALKKTGALLIFLLIILLTSAAGAFAQSESERITSFHSDISVNPDSTMQVTETISVYCSGAQIRHGIYRDFPTSYQDERGGRYIVGFNLLKVTQDGHPEPYHLEKKSNGVRIYIGDPNVLLTHGPYTYTLTYTTSHQLGFFSDHDELYWNVTGNGWIFPIDQASATVTLPAGIQAANIKVEGYTGAQDAKGQDYTASVDDTGKAQFATTRSLSSYEGLTIVVSFPKGVVQPPKSLLPPALANRAWLLVIIIALLPLLAYYLWAWFKVGNDPNQGVIMVQYEPPEKLSPAAIRYIRNMGYDNKGLAAGMINLAVKGKVKITQQHKDYTVTGQAGTALDTSLPTEEQYIIGRLPGAGNEFEFTQKYDPEIASLNTGFQKVLDKLYGKGELFTFNWGYLGVGFLLTALLLALVALYTHRVGYVEPFNIDRGNAPSMLYFAGLLFLSAGAGVLSVGLKMWQRLLTKRSSVISTLPGAIFITLFSLPFVGVGLFLSLVASATYGLFLVGAVVVTIIFAQLLPAYTVSGRRLLDNIEGFRRYLAAVEQDPLNRLNPPQKTPQIFEKYLPYALALDAEQQWGEQFAEVLRRAGIDSQAYSPSWYSGGSFSSFSPGSFASSFGSGLSGAISSSSTAPSSSSGGGGGGSSGGGGGGGGGGGW
jgi:uncharacterized membrane protein YgcG